MAEPVSCAIIKRCTGEPLSLASGGNVVLIQSGVPNIQ